MGSSSYHYIVADPYTVPPEARPFYTEKVLQLPHTWLITNLQPRDSFNSSNKLRYCNLGRQWKIDEDVMQSWCRIVKRVRGSTLRLLLLEQSPLLDLTRLDLLRAHNASQRMQRWWTDHCGLPLSTLMFQPPINDENVYKTALQSNCDVWLDTPLYGGGITAVEAVAARLPLVSARKFNEFNNNHIRQNRYIAVVGSNSCNVLVVVYY
jgi:protein O-GlcNAc transferase